MGPRGECGSSTSLGDNLFQCLTGLRVNLQLLLGCSFPQHQLVRQANCSVLANATQGQSAAALPDKLHPGRLADQPSFQMSVSWATRQEEQLGSKPRLPAGCFSKCPLIQFSGKPIHLLLGVTESPAAKDHGQGGRETKQLPSVTTLPRPGKSSPARISSASLLPPMLD